MLAANDEFDLLRRHALGLFRELLAEAVDFVFTQGDPDFTDCVHPREFAQSMNENGRSRQFGKLLRRLWLFGLRVFTCRQDRRHARPKSSSGNDDNHLHGGQSVYERQRRSSNERATAERNEQLSPSGSPFVIYDGPCLESATGAGTEAEDPDDTGTTAGVTGTADGVWRE